MSVESTAGRVVETFAVGPLGCNCTILGDRETGEGLIIDPGWDAELILGRVEDLGLRITALIHTHAHIDHINGTAAVHEALGAACSLHEDDLFLYEDTEGQAQMMASWGLPIEAFAPPTPDRLLLDGDVVGAGASEVEVLHTPGHTPGSLCFHSATGDRPILFSGDTLFAGSVGRTDLPGGDSARLARSIKEQLYGLDPETLVIPGHGPATSIAEEQRANPFVRA